MLPPWRDRLLVGLGPDRLSIVRLGGARARTAAVCEAIERPAGGDDGAWTWSLECLGTYLAAQRKADVTVVLSNRLVRYRVLPWSAELFGDELTTYAERQFEDVYGALSRDWTIRISPGQYGKWWLASAVDSGLLDGIRRLSGRRGARIVSIQPYLMAAANRAALESRVPDQLFALLEPGRLLVAALESGTWKALATHRLEPGRRGDVSDLLKRDALRFGMPYPVPTVLYGHANEAPDEELPLGRKVVSPRRGIAGAHTGEFDIALAWDPLESTCRHASLSIL